MMLKYDLAAICTNMHDVKYGVISEHAQFSLVRMMQSLYLQQMTLVFFTNTFRRK